MAASEASKFNCPNKGECDLNEEDINDYDQTQFMEILGVLEDHGIDPDDAENFMKAQTLLFEHLKLREEFLGQQDGTGTHSVVQYRCSKIYTKVSILQEV